MHSQPDQIKTIGHKKPHHVIKIHCWPYARDQLQVHAPDPEQVKQLEHFKWIFGFSAVLFLLGLFYYQFALHQSTFVFVVLAFVLIGAGFLDLFFRIFSKQSLSRLSHFTSFLAGRLSSVAFTRHHVEFKWTFGALTVDRQKLRWRDISRVYIERHGDTLSSDSRLCFKDLNGKVWALSSQQIATREQWDKIVRALDDWCPVEPMGLDLCVFDHVPSIQTSFTTLWLEALSEPPKRHRLEPLLPGTLLKEGRYVVEQQIGVGGQGRAYLAKNRKLSTVVIKEYLLPIYVDVKACRQALENFEREASMLSGLDHPNVVKLIEFFCEDHRAYLVLDHVTGSSLRSLVNASGPLKPAKMVEYGKNMCDILTYLHNRTPLVVHGDFTPDNLIVQSDETLKLIDFTIAQQSDETITSIVAGKSAYMPPEQYRGIVNIQTDIYALGGTLYFLLTGEDPEPLTCLHPILQREELNQDLDKIIAKCTALDAQDRYRLVEQVKEELHRLSI